MSVLDTYFTLLTEGEMDVNHRRQAQDALRRAQAALKTPKAKAAMETMGNEYGNFVAFDMGKLLGDQSLEGLELQFAYDEESVGKHAGTFRPKPNPTITLNFDKQVTTDGPTLAKMLDIKRDTFTHEFIHYLDFKRMGSRGADVVAKASSTQKSGGDDDARQRRYTNDPLEYNAFFQAGVGNIENYLHSLPPESRLKVAKKMLGDSPDQFWKRVTDSLKGQPWFYDKFVKNLDPKMANKFKKRVAQAYTEIMGGLEAGQKWRGGPEKEKAAQVDRLKAAQAKAQAKKGKG